MKILTSKEQREILNILAANQIIFNAFETLEGIDKFEAYSQFCENSASAISKLGGINALNEYTDLIFTKDTNND